MEDDSGEVPRVLVLFREEGETSWSKLELAWNATTGWAEGSTGAADAPIHYLVQAVDATGNVALALDHGNPFTRVTPVEELWSIYVPFVTKSSAP